MKNLSLLSLGIVLLSFSCADEKFTEKRGVALEQSADLGGGESSEEKPIVVSVDDEAKDTDVVTSENSLEGADCADMVGVERVAISGSTHDQTITSTDAYALRVTGNKNAIKLELKGADTAAKIPGICLDLAGNQNLVSVKVLVQLGTVYVRARGNQAKVAIEVGKGASVGKLKVNAAGHEPNMELKGEGTYPCEAETIKKPMAVTCVKAP